MTENTAAPVEPEPLDFHEAAERWRQKARQHYLRSRRFDELAVEARRAAERDEAMAKFFDELVREGSGRDVGGPSRPA